MVKLPVWVEVGGAAEYPLPLCCIGGAARVHIWDPSADAYGFKPICGASNYTDAFPVGSNLARRPVCRDCRHVAIVNPSPWISEKITEYEQRVALERRCDGKCQGGYDESNKPYCTCHEEGRSSDT